MGSTISAIIRIRNLTYSNVTKISIYDYDNFDFGNCRLNQIFNGKIIPSKTSIERSIDISTLSSSCPFTIKLIFENSTEDIFRLNFKTALENNTEKIKHIVQTHQIRLKTTGPRVLEIIIENTQPQIENSKAEKLMEEGCKLIELGKLNEASIKFLEATQKANNHLTIQNLELNRKKLKKVRTDFEEDRKAKQLNSEGFKLLKNCEYLEAQLKFQEALNLTNIPETRDLIEDNLGICQDGLKNQKAREVFEEGIQILKSGSEPERAQLKLNEALACATDLSLIKTIKSVKCVGNPLPEIVLNQLEMSLPVDFTPESIEKTRISTTGKILVGLTGGIALGLSVICASFVSPAFRKFCLPYIPATKTQVENVLVALRGRSGLLVDLGSGDGRIVLGSARNGFTAHGVELNFWLILYSKIDAVRKGLSAKSRFFRRDLWKFQLGDYDNIVIFGVEQMMGDLEKKFQVECKNNCWVVACRFPLPNKDPIRIIGSGVDTVWVYSYKK